MPDPSSFGPIYSNSPFLQLAMVTCLLRYYLVTYIVRRECMRTPGFIASRLESRHHDQLTAKTNVDDAAKECLAYPQSPHTTDQAAKAPGFLDTVNTRRFHHNDF